MNEWQRRWTFRPWKMCWCLHNSKTNNIISFSLLLYATLLPLGFSLSQHKFSSSGDWFRFNCEPTWIIRRLSSNQMNQCFCHLGTCNIDIMHSMHNNAYVSNIKWINSEWSIWTFLHDVWWKDGMGCDCHWLLCFFLFLFFSLSHLPTVPG